MPHTLCERLQPFWWREKEMPFPNMAWGPFKWAVIVIVMYIHHDEGVYTHRTHTHLCSHHYLHSAAAVHHVGVCARGI